MMTIMYGVQVKYRDNNTDTIRIKTVCVCDQETVALNIKSDIQKYDSMIMNMGRSDYNELSKDGNNMSGKLKYIHIIMSSHKDFDYYDTILDTFIEEIPKY